MRDKRIKGSDVMQRDLAKLFGISEQGFTNRMRRDTFTVSDALKIADYFDMELVIRDKHGTYEYTIKK